MYSKLEFPIPNILLKMFYPELYYFHIYLEVIDSNSMESNTHEYIKYGIQVK